MLFVRIVFLDLILLVNQLLLLLDILEHVLALRQDHIVGEHLRVFIVETTQFGQSHLGLLVSVRPLQELIDVVQYQVVFEDRYYVSILIIDQVIYCLHIVVVSICAVLIAQVPLNHHPQLVVSTEYCRTGIQPQTVGIHCVGFIAEGAIFG